MAEEVVPRPLPEEQWEAMKEMRESIWDWSIVESMVASEWCVMSLW